MIGGTPDARLPEERKWITFALGLLWLFYLHSCASKPLVSVGGYGELEPAMTEREKAEGCVVQWTKPDGLAQIGCPYADDPRGWALIRRCLLTTHMKPIYSEEYVPKLLIRCERHYTGVIIK